MTNHLAEAKMHAQRAEGKASEWAQLDGLLAIAHAVIAICERLDKTAEDAELKVERQERYQEYQAQRKMGMTL